MKLIYVAMAMLLMFLVGCALMAGHQNPDGTHTEGILDYVGEIATAAGSLIPGLGILTGLGGTATAVAAAIRGKQWKTAATSTFQGVEDFLATPEGQAVAKKVKEKLASNHTIAKVTPAIRKIIGEVKAITTPPAAA